MDAWSISEALSRRLSSEYFVVPRPDHPELLSGPTVLVGGPSGLTAIFRIGRHSTTHELRSRVIAAKLALPAHTRFIGIAENDATVSHQIEQHAFDHIVRADDVSELISLAAERESRGERENQLREIQANHAIAYATFLQMADPRGRDRISLTNTGAMGVLEQFASRFGRPRSRDRVWSNKRVPSRYQYELRYEHRTVAADPVTTTKKYGRSYAAEFCFESLDEDFSLDRGIPYLQGRRPRVLLVDVWPSTRGDVTKPARTSAFCGWVMTVPTSPEDIEQLLERTSDLLRRGFHEPS